MRYILSLLALFVPFALGLAFAQEYALVIDGQPVPQTAITVNGEVYLPLAALDGTGAVAIFDGSTLSLSLPGAVVTGGANQRESLEGCLGDDLFNGVWRAKVLSVAPLTGEKPGWGVTLELKNGTAVTLAPAFTGVSGIGEGMHLVLEDGTILPVDPYDVQQLTYSSLPQGGGATHELKFYRPSGSGDAAKPEKFLLEINPDGVGFSEQRAGVAYSTLTPSLRVRLECGS